MCYCKNDLAQVQFIMNGNRNFRDMTIRKKSKNYNNFCGKRSCKKHHKILRFSDESKREREADSEREKETKIETVHRNVCCFH